MKKTLILIITLFSLWPQITQAAKVKTKKRNRKVKNITLTKSHIKGKVERPLNIPLVPRKKYQFPGVTSNLTLEKNFSKETNPKNKNNPLRVHN